MPKKPKEPTRGRGKKTAPKVPLKSRKGIGGRKGVDWRPAYLKALAVEAGHRMKAAEDARIDYTCVWEERKKNPDFARAELAVIEQGTDALEDEAFRRAYSGVESKHYDAHGNLRCTRTDYSDTLLLRILETRRPQWRPKSTVDVNNSTTFATRADRKKALQEARENRDKPLD